MNHFSPCGLIYDEPVSLQLILLLCLGLATHFVW